MEQRIPGKTDFSVSAMTWGGAGGGMGERPKMRALRRSSTPWSGLNVIDVAPVHGKGKAEGGRWNGLARLGPPSRCLQPHSRSVPVSEAICLGASPV